ncbi:MAG: [FeFe] hydrogenase H-cluster maturation GTPase HydF [Ignavibacteriaceae bacterium]
MTPESNSSRPHIAVVGRRNVGKSLLVNSMLGQNLFNESVAVETTVDPVKKAFELLPYGPVVIVDTAGIDDEGELGKQKISETIKILSSSDFVLVVVDARNTLQSKELELLAYLDKLQINYVVAVNKIEFGVNPELLEELKELRITHFEVSCKEKAGIEELKRKIIRLLPYDNQSQILDGIISSGDIIVFVLPTDINAPKGKLIVSQVQMIREALDENISVIICKEKELRSTLDNLKSFPDMIVVDSHAFLYTVANVPEKIKLTTFSILMAKHKGDLGAFVKGLRRIDELKNGDKVLIAEACSHHAKEDEMSTERISRWLHNHTRKDLKIDINQDHEFPNNLSDYKLIIHCNGCMLTHRAMQTRINQAKLLDIPIVNFGVFIAYMHGAIPRALVPFKETISEWRKTRK